MKVGRVPIYKTHSKSKWIVGGRKWKVFKKDFRFFLIKALPQPTRRFGAAHATWAPRWLFPVFLALVGREDLLGGFHLYEDTYYNGEREKNKM